MRVTMLMGLFSAPRPTFLAVMFLVGLTQVHVLQAQTLPDAMVLALIRSPEMKSAEASVVIAEENLIQEEAAGLPQIFGRITFAGRYRDTLSADGFDLPVTAELVAQQPVFTFGRIENAVAAAEYLIQAQAMRKDITEQVILLATVEAYVDILRGRDLLKQAKATLMSVRRQIGFTREAMDQGFATQTDLSQAESRLYRSEIELLAFQRGLDASIARFQRIVGELPGDLAKLPPLPDLPLDLDTALAIASTSSPVLLAEQAEQRAAKQSVRAAIAELGPNISFIGIASAGTRGETTGFQRSSALLGFQIDIPFSNGGANYSGVREVQANVEQQAAELTSAIRNIVQSTGVAWVVLDAARQEAKARQLEIVAADIALAAVREEADGGFRTILDVLDAEQELFEARTEEINLRYEVYVQSYRLLAAIGKMSVDHLGLKIPEGYAGEFAISY